MRLLVTGAAGFIGSNFVRYWLERRPDDHVVAYDLLTYAGDRENVPEGVPLRAGGHRRLRARGADARASTTSTWSSTSRPSRTTGSPCTTRRSSATNVLGTQPLLEASRRQRRDAVPPRLDVRGLRRPRPGLRRVVLGGVALPPRTPYNASKAAATTTCGRTSRPSSCRRRSRTARTTTGRSSSRRR